MSPKLPEGLALRHLAQRLSFWLHLTMVVATKRKACRRFSNQQREFVKSVAFDLAKKIKPTINSFED
jgi:hypothetical protein